MGKSAEVEKVLRLWRKFRRTPAVDKHNSTQTWSRAYMAFERAMDALAKKEADRG